MLLFKFKKNYVNFLIKFFFHLQFYKAHGEDTIKGHYIIIHIVDTQLI